jgi:AcrR family transcriptional regulator
MHSMQVHGSSGPPRPGLREQKKLETRDRLVAAALRLFEAQGYAATTVEEIAAAAAVSTRTFFHYFESKQDVLLGFEHELLAVLVGEVEQARRAASPSAVMWSALEAVARRIDADAARLRPLYALVLTVPSVHRRSLELQQDWQRQFAEALARHARGRDRHERAQVLAAVGLACLRTAASAWARDGRARPVVPSLQAARRAVQEELAA